MTSRTYATTPATSTASVCASSGVGGEMGGSAAGEVYFLFERCVSRVKSSFDDDNNEPREKEGEERHSG